MLMLLPLDKKIDWKNPPVVTLLLILINVVIFYSFQSNDESIEHKAAQFYQQSGLAKLEAPVYQKYLDEQKQQQENQPEPEYDFSKMAEDNDSLQILRIYADRDYGYKQALKEEKINGVSQSDLIQVKTKRKDYLAQLDDSTFRNYSLRPAETTFITLISHMFLHADNGHLWGNMLFLFIVGYVVEAILGRWLFLFAYLLTGLGASGLDILVNPINYNFHLGASGAIAGVMGMYATLFGLRKIQFFYNILFWVGRLKAPAIIMLVVWVAKEALQMIFVDSNVNFLAHLGGLLSGALVAYLLIQHTDKVNTEYMDAEEKKKQYAQLMTDGIQFFAEMNFEKAKYCFVKVLNEFPEDIEAITYIYRSSLSDPSANDYHKYAKLLILVSLNTDNFDLMYSTWKAYSKQTQSGNRLGFECSCWVFEQLLHHNKLKDAEQLIFRLFKSTPAKAELAGCFMQLSKKYLSLKNKPSADKYSKAIIKYFPTSDEVALAKSIISTGKPVLSN